MKEILVWGDITKEFERLGINGKQTWSGYGWYDSPMSVWELSEDEFAILDKDDDEEHWYEAECGWRWCKGSVLSDCSYRFGVNGHWMTGFKNDYRHRHFKYKHLLEYLCDELGVSNEKNITAVSMDLARYNNMTLAQLFAKYQGSEPHDPEWASYRDPVDIKKCRDALQPRPTR